MKNLFSLAGLMVFLISGNAHAGVGVETDTVQEAQVRKKEYFPFIKKTLEDLDINGKKKSLRGKTRISVPFFRLNFVREDKYRNAVTTGMGHSTTARVKSELTGVDPAVFQTATNEVYADFLKQLEAAGYELVSLEEVKKVEKFAGMESKYPDIEDDAAKVTALQLPFPGRFKNPSPAISEAVNAVVLQVDLTVDYLIINANQKRFNVLKDASHVDVSQGISIMGTITAFSENDMTTMLIQQPVTSERPFGTVYDETSALSKAGDVMVAASGWLGNGIGTRRQSSKTLAIAADTQGYQLAVADAMAQLNQNIAGTLQTLREAK